MQRISAFIAAVIGNILIMVPFARALIDPLQNTYFIYNTAIFIFIVEFLSLHSSGMLTSSGSSKFKTKDKIGLFSIYCIFALSLTLIVKSPYPILIFIVSLVTKTLFVKASLQRDARIGLGVILLITTAFAVVIFSGTLSHLFAFPPDIIAARPENTSGIFVDTPQTVLVWGLLYYGLDTLFALILAFKPDFVKVQFK